MSADLFRKYIDIIKEATGDQKFDSMMNRMTAEPKYPDKDMPPTSIPELIQWANKNNKPYHECFAQWARKNGFKNVNDALVWFGDNVDPSNPWGPKDYEDVFGRPAAEELEDAAKHDPKAAELMKVYRCYEEIVFDWPDDYRQMNMREGEVIPLKRTKDKVQHGKRTFPPTQRNVTKPEKNVIPLKKDNVKEEVSNSKDKETIKDFIKWSIRRLHIKQPYPRIVLSANTEKAQAGHHTGVHTMEDNKIWIYIGNRNLVDILRTVFHELVHERQAQLNMIKPGDSYPGSPIEAMADMLAGKYIKIYGKQHSEIFQ